MKVIVYAQLPVKLYKILEKIGVDSIHVQELPNKNETSDADIIKYADDTGLIVITKDLDFYHSHMANGKPGKLLLILLAILKTGNYFICLKIASYLISNSLSKNKYLELTVNGIVTNK